MTNSPERMKTGTFEDFKAFTLAVARGDALSIPTNRRFGSSVATGEASIRFQSLEAGSTQLSVENRDLPRLIAMRAPRIYGMCREQGVLA